MLEVFHDVCVIVGEGIRQALELIFPSQPRGMYFYEISSREEGKEITGRGKFVVQ